MNKKSLLLYLFPCTPSPHRRNTAVLIYWCGEGENMVVGLRPTALLCVSGRAIKTEQLCGGSL